MTAASQTVDGAPAPAAPAWAKFFGDLGRQPEHSRALRAATLAAVVVAAVAVITNDVGGAFLWALALVVIPAGALTSHLRRHNTSPLVPVILTLVTIAIVVRFVIVNGNPTSPGELRVPLAELLVTLEAMRSFALRSRRELRFALASSLALISVAGALSISMAFAGFAAAWAAAGALALMLAYRSEVIDVGQALAGPRPHSPIPVRALVAALVGVGVVGAVAFLVVPAAKSSRLLAFASKLPHVVPVPNPGGLSNPSLGRDDPGRPGDHETNGPAPEGFGYFGFADQLDTSVRGRPDNTLVMRVRSSAPDFWRGQTFDTWDGRRWTLSDARTAVVSNGSPLQLLQPIGEPPVGGEELIQTFALEVSGPNLIFAANQPTQVYIEQRSLFETPDGAIRTGIQLDKGAVYTVVSRRPQTTAGRLRAAGDAAQLAPPELVQRYTRLPQIPDRVRALATELSQGKATTYDTVLAMEAWMGEHTQYSLDIPPLPEGEDSVERFLFVDRTGFCEQIATSLVVMLRSQGIPARLAVGYAPGERNPFTGFYEVRASDAHAWTEVYFPGIGWQAFDPTAQVPLAGDAPPDAARVGLRAYLARHLPDLTSPLGALVGVVLLVGAGVLWREPLGLLLARLRRRRNRTWADAQRARLEALGADLGREREAGETVVEYAAVLQRTVLRDPAVGEVAAAITADEFAPMPLSEDARRQVEQQLSVLTQT
jgi:protein-glutamine gamma-glutamyltransferase